VLELCAGVVEGSLPRRCVVPLRLGRWRELALAHVHRRHRLATGHPLHLGEHERRLVAPDLVSYPSRHTETGGERGRMWAAARACVCVCVWWCVCVCVCRLALSIAEQVVRLVDATVLVAPDLVGDPSSIHAETGGGRGRMWAAACVCVCV
jgi:hypothetical protein